MSRLMGRDGPRLQVSRACVHCQRRKTRCAGSNNGQRACSYCLSTGKTCSFDQRPDRTPLTRKNLDDAETRCMQLRSLLEKFNPGLDIDAELAAFGSSPDVVQDSPDGVEDGTAREDYEWNEASSHVSPGSSAMHKDGMAILPSLNAGYLGRSSGSEILQEVTALLPPSTILSPSGSDESHPLPAQPAARGVGPDPPQLASLAVINTLIDGYFRLFNTSYPILHEPTFRREVANRDKVCANPTWRIIYYMILAIGSWLLDNNTTPDQCPYYSAARSRISMQVFEAGTTRTVQALLLMGNYLQKRDRPNTGYSLIGLAQRIAFGIGLHRERSSVDDKIVFERHRQLFWIVYCFDSGFSITTGRPMAVLEGFIDQALPRNIDDQDCDNSSVVPAPVNYPTTYSALIAQAQLVRIANGIHHEFLSAKTANQKMEYQLAEIMAQKLDVWRDNLPTYFTSPDVPAWFLGPRSIVLWKEQNLRILLWRGTKKVHPYLPSRMDARGRCLDAAMETIQSISSFVASYESSLHPGIVWYGTYFIFQAMLVLEASCLGRDGQPDQDFPCDSGGWEASISAATQCLESLARRNSSAALCLEFIERIHRSAGLKAGEMPGTQMDSAQQATDGVLTYDYLFDPTAWTSEMDNIATDPVLRELIGEAFLDFEAVSTVACDLDLSV
ncbi:Zn(2)-C6 fungal-type domain-containing protein [Fusarium sp. Ph1]|nr:Zn(2)-C6 fungal-type domain-containing protein [Fusarium sp. Ph1]